MAFTNLSVVLLLLGRYDDAIWHVASYTTAFVCVSFHAVRLCDATCYARMRAKNRWSARVFHVGNVVLHLVPLLVVLASPPPRTRPTVGHLVLSLALFVAWCANARLDEVYVPLSPSTWAAGVTAGLAAQLALHARLASR